MYVHILHLRVGSFEDCVFQRVLVVNEASASFHLGEKSLGFRTLHGRVHFDHTISSSKHPPPPSPPVQKSYLHPCLYTINLAVESVLTFLMSSALVCKKICN